MSVNPQPTFIPHNAVDIQQLQLLHQIQNHAISASQAPLLLLMFLPLPISWKLSIYNFLSHLPLPHLSPMAITIIVLVGPILSLVFLYFAVKTILSAIKLFSPVIFKRFTRKDNEKKFLELTFPSDTGKSAYATQQLYTLIHTLARRKNFIENLIGEKKQYSLEIVSSKNEGIRFLLVAPVTDADILKRSLVSYLPGIKIVEVTDYLDEKVTPEERQVSVAELKLASHFALPLNKQNALDEHDPIAYLTGHMTNLAKDALVSFQIVTTPVLKDVHGKQIGQMNALRRKMYKGEPLTQALSESSLDKLGSIPGISVLVFGIKAVSRVFSFLVMFIFSMIMGVVDSSGKSVPFLMVSKMATLPQEILNPYEQELKTVVKEKIDQHLFESTIRILIMGKDPDDANIRMSGLLSSFGLMSSPYQTLTSKSSLIVNPTQKRFGNFKERTLSQSTTFNQNPILSTSEMSDLFHFPYTNTTKTEDMVKVLSPELPAPLALKNGRKLDVIFAKNTYGNSVTDIGLTDEERARHVYLLGRTGSGKSTIIYHMAKEDIEKGRGIAVVDPHGDLAESLLAVIPKERINDVIYFNPFDLKYPIGINLLELPKGLEDEDLELEKELVCESVISVFRRIFSKEEHTNAHRIEYILRNTIYTSFAVPNRTLFTLYNLINDTDYRNKIVKTLDDENLKSFWKNEFGKAGSYQIVKMVSGVTAKVGRFLFSPTAKRIIEQEKSTINFDEILSQRKILICNLSEGKLGEDTAQVLGLTVIAKIHQAALRRARIESTDRTPFYLFVDEFQNFATTSFTKILSGGRKFGLRMTLAEQSSAQQSDRQVVNVILANTGTVICFATASPMDAEMMESQFAPQVSRHDFTNLPKYRFYMKMSAGTPQEPFSGETLPIDTKRGTKMVERIVSASQNNYAIIYKKKVVKPTTEDIQKKGSSGKKSIGSLTY